MTVFLFNVNFLLNATVSKALQLTEIHCLFSSAALQAVLTVCHLCNVFSYCFLKAWFFLPVK